jgi:hypothetical protein
MVETRWTSGQAPGAIIVLVLVIIGLAATVAQARSAPERVTTADSGLSPCPGGIAALQDTLTSVAGDGTWFRTDPVLDDGAIVGQTLLAASATSDRPVRVALDREAFAWGPSGGLILAGSDDGASSTMFIVDPSERCAVTVGSSSDVIRRGIMEPGGSAIVEFRVDRATRADLGVWRRPFDGGEATRILPPIERDDGYGITWSTEFAVDAGDDRLVVQSCGEHACRSRLLGADGDVALVADAHQGPLIGLAGDRLVTLGACPGLPCELRSTDLTTGATDVLHEASGIARLVADARGRTTIVHEVIDGAARLRAVLPDGSAPVDLGLLPRLDGLLAPGSVSGSDAETAAGAIPIGPDGRVATDGVHLFEEVLR